MTRRVRARAIALYLPQFHPIADNDEWWGPGFTEWTNVARARPLFRGHQQPRIPGDLGFYDLRLPETRAAQSQLAAAAGIEAFAYWHYWFGAGRQILERPFDEVLKTGEPDFPFCLAWANQSWTGIWHGAPDRILVEQTYPGPQDIEAHFAHVLPAFRDERYVRLADKPVFYVQSPSHIPRPLEFTERWRALADDAGLSGLYLVGEHVRDASPEQLGFDAWVRPVSEFFPHRLKPQGRLARALHRGPQRGTFSATAAAYQARPPVSHREHPSLLTGWDNTPRSGRRGVVLTEFDQQRFAEHCAHVIASVADEPDDERLVFVKSWNEWAEGNYLEPDWDEHHARLDCLADALLASSPEDS